MYRTQVKNLHAYMMRHLREIMKVTWEDKVTNKEIYKRIGIRSMEDTLIEKNLRCVGHVHRMDTDRLPRQLLYSRVATGTRNQGRPILRFKDVVKRNLKWKDIKPSTWQTTARDRPTWKNVIRGPKQ